MSPAIYPDHPGKHRDIALESANAQDHRGQPVVALGLAQLREERHERASLVSDQTRQQRGVDGLYVGTLEIDDEDAASLHGQ